MPPPIDRDFPVSKYYAEVYGEQPKLGPSRRPIRTPNEKTIPGILAQLKALTGFEPPSQPIADATIFPDPANPPTDAEERNPEP